MHRIRGILSIALAMAVMLEAPIALAARVDSPTPRPNLAEGSSSRTVTTRNGSQDDDTAKRSDPDVSDEPQPSRSQDDDTAKRSDADVSDEPQPSPSQDDDTAKRSNADVSDEPQPSDETSEPTKADAAVRRAPAPLTGRSGLDPEGLYRSEQEAYALYMEGLDAFENKRDPDLAIDLWSQAVATLPDAPPYERSRGALTLRMVIAHELRYRLKGEIADLERQLALLAGYQQRLPSMFPGDPTAQTSRRQQAERRIAEVEAEIERLTTDYGTADEQLEKSLRGDYAGLMQNTWRPRADDIGWHARPDDPRDHGQQVDLDDEPDKRVEPEPKPAKRGTGLIISGSVVGVLGLAGMGIGAGGMVMASQANDFDPNQTPDERREQIARGERGNAMSLAGWIAGGTLTAVGVALLGVGLHRRRRAPSSVAFVPTVSAHMQGVTLHGRF